MKRKRRRNAWWHHSYLCIQHTWAFSVSGEAIVIVSHTPNITLMTNKNNDLIKYHSTPLISIFDNYGPSCFTRHMNLHKPLSPELLLRQENWCLKTESPLPSFALDPVSDCWVKELETFAYPVWATLMKGLRPEFELHGKFICFAHTPHTHHLVGTLSNSLARSSHETIT